MNVVGMDVVYVNIQQQIMYVCCIIMDEWSP